MTSMKKRIIIKILQGKELEIIVDNSDPILSIKREVYLNLKIPIWKQKLIYQGKLLTDENLVSEYSAIKDGAKINLMIKNPEPLVNVLQKLFLKSFPREEAEKKAAAVNEKFEEYLKSLSGDDFIRILNHYREEDLKVLNSCAPVHSQ